MIAGRRAFLVPLWLGLACLDQASEAEARTLRIRIAGMAYQPAAVTAAVGDVIEWSNDDFVDHSATEPGGAFDITIPAGKKAIATIARAGSFSFFCRFHPNMTGTVTVK